VLTIREPQTMFAEAKMEGIAAFHG